MKKVLYAVLFCIFCALFIYYRIPSLLAHYVAYTYDQGRDFIAGANIVRLHKIPFIGPTTGINGLFHGSWWYYLLAIPYILFKGAPIGYYWFNFSIQFSLLIVLMVFLKKEFGSLTSLLFGILIVVAPYFTFISLFAGNNVMVLPALLIFLICNYYLFTSKKISLPLLFVTGFSLALVGEFELSFGIFLVPLYLIGILIFRSLRKALINKNGLMFLFGLVVGFMPRILFELKNSFTQTKVLLSFLFHPKLYSAASPYLSRVSERWILFKTYYFEMFSERYFAYIFLISICVIAGLTLIAVLQKRTKTQPIFIFYIYLLGGLFFLATLYKDFFWKNYYEGIHYIFLFVFISLIGQQIQKKHVLIKRSILFSLLFGFCALGMISARETYMHKPPFDGLQVQEAIVNYVNKNQDQHQEYCLRIYTPSVIPHTYNYLFLVRNVKPSSEWVNGTCWFIVEADSYKQRRDDWLTINEPKDKHTVVVKTIKDVEIRYYKVNPQE
ncbi:MAG: hypothetical protein NTV98_01535 [Candidatus Roizmanbacteria bacterium]|nr:hypothetical protein [Candidatus Roizmanbacteria bacterium]